MDVTSTLDPMPAADGASPVAGSILGPDRASVASGPREYGAAQYAQEYPYVIKEPGRFASFFVRLTNRMPTWAAPAGVALCLGGGIAYTLLMDPTSAGAGSTPTCVVKLFTGFDCPGCGGTRAAWYLLHGDVAAAARHHLPVVFATPFLAYMYVSWALGTITRRVSLPQLRVPMTVAMGFIGAWMTFAVLRNLPWAPFTWFFV